MRTEPLHDPSTALIGTQLLSFLWLLAVAPLAVLLLVVAESGRGRLFACAALLGGILPLVATLAWRRRPRGWVGAVAGGGALWLGLAGLVAMLAPTGHSPKAARATHAFASSNSSYARLAPGNLLPECDQLMLGFTLAPLLDPLLTQVQASELKRLTRLIYAEVEGDTDFAALGSVMTNAYGDLLGQAWQVGHSYVYVPPTVEQGGALPVLVFFHGSGGNFKAYLWILSKLADRIGFALVVPSGGFGNWTEDASRQGLDAALEAVARKTPVDRARIHLLGLSNGGLAVSQLAASHGSQFASVVFLSPVFDAAELHSSSFATEISQRRILVVTGARDDRVPLSYVEENAAGMTKAGAKVTLKTFAGADHFLLFSHRVQLLAILEEWLGPGR